MTRLLLISLLGLAACSGAAEECNAKKARARTAWGEVGVRYGLALSNAETAMKDPQGRLAALERQPDAPAEGKAALQAEIDAKKAEILALQPKVEAAQAVASAFAGKTAAEARALSAANATKLEGQDVADAVRLADEAAAACEGVD